ncbi:EamA family transporter [Heliorestis convoluta]|uniref:Small multidrug resistance transmembrane protein n=1 Tax=Heliorestis convoluta TaxID=356322 RepID=A0A5Q2N2X5_9FIRM|nr:EamA family transporter [Heliorestis convoluta]QGG49348.1 Small multidrug resistance transmembrane protein [Heliorestis convoluta]
MKHSLGDGLPIILLSIFMGAGGQVLFKLGANKLAFPEGAPLGTMAVQGFLQIVKNPLILGGFLLFGMSSLLWIVAISKVELSLAYPMVSLGYVLVLFLSWALLGETITLIRISGVLVICLGVFLIAQS